MSKQGTAAWPRGTGFFLGSVILFLSLVTSLSIPQRGAAMLAKGKKVALFQVHFEGNVGDQMETIPLLKKLSEWGVVVDCYLSLWLPKEKRLNPLVQAKIGKYVHNIYDEGIPQRHVLKSRGYDLAIVTPGPTVNELRYCFESAKTNQNVSLVYFGISLGTESMKSSYSRQQYCLKLIGAREVISYGNIKGVLGPDNSKQTKLLLSGDISFSYLKDKYNKPDIATVFPNISATLSMFQGRQDWVLLFSRAQNFGDGLGVHIKGSKVYVKSVHNESLVFNTKDVLFGSSDVNEDTAHYNDLQAQFGVSSKQIAYCRTVEEMFALVSSAPHIITDRYHPGVASLILKKPLTVTMYIKERVKMAGLNNMKRYSYEEVREMNRKAFDALLNMLNSRPIPPEDLEVSKHFKRTPSKKEFNIPLPTVAADEEPEYEIPPEIPANSEIPANPELSTNSENSENSKSSSPSLRSPFADTIGENSNEEASSPGAKDEDNDLIDGDDRNPKYLDSNYIVGQAKEIHSQFQNTWDKLETGIDFSMILSVIGFVIFCSCWSVIKKFMQSGKLREKLLQQRRKKDIEFGQSTSTIDSSFGGTSSHSLEEDCHKEFSGSHRKSKIPKSAKKLTEGVRAERLVEQFDTIQAFNKSDSTNVVESVIVEKDTIHSISTEGMKEYNASDIEDEGGSSDLRKMPQEPPMETVANQWEDDWDDDRNKKNGSVDDDTEQVRARKNS